MTRGAKGSSITSKARKAATNKAWYATHSDQVKATGKTWRIANPNKLWHKTHKEAASLKAAAWKKANPAKTKAINAAWYAKNSDKSAVNRKAWRTANTTKANEYSRAWHLKMCEASAGRKKPKRCDVCKCSGAVIHFEHDHKDGHFRGWVCHRCNSALGYAKDSVVLLRKLAAYLDPPLVYSIPVNSHCRMSAADKRILGPRPNRCQVCKQTGRIVMDHCHKRNLFRGWLCGHCNSALGYAHDSAKTLRKLADYLDSDKLRQKEKRKNEKANKHKK